MYIVCTGATGRAVIVGHSDTEPKPGEVVRLTDVRMVLKWTGSAGLFGLAATGPAEGSRLTQAVAFVAATARQVLPVSQAAEAAIAAWPVA